MDPINQLLGSFYSNEKLNNIGIDLSNPPVVPDENDQYTNSLDYFFDNNNLFDDVYSMDDDAIASMDGRAINNNNEEVEDVDDLDDLDDLDAEEDNEDDDDEEDERPTKKRKGASTTSSEKGMGEEDMSNLDPASYRKMKNRLHAKKARLKKKEFISKLESSIKDLQKDNETFRKYISIICQVDPATVMQKEIDSASKLFPSFSTSSSIPSPSSSSHSSIPVRLTSTRPKKDLRNTLEPSDMFFLKSLQDCKQSFVISNPNLPDDPIIFCSDNFCDMTGYSRREMLGRNCRFLQGPETNRDVVRDLKKSIEAGKHSVSCIKNYKKDGTPFWNYLSISPLKDARNNIVMNVGVQLEIYKNDLPTTTGVVSK